jgi:hypothetical protein
MLCIPYTWTTALAGMTYSNRLSALSAGSLKCEKRIFRITMNPPTTILMAAATDTGHAQVQPVRIGKVGLKIHPMRDPPKATNSRGGWQLYVCHPHLSATKTIQSFLMPKKTLSCQRQGILLSAIRSTLCYFCSLPETRNEQPRIPSSIHYPSYAIRYTLYAKIRRPHPAG